MPLTGTMPACQRRSVDVWLFVGVNGVGKTTTVGKVASRLAGSGERVLLAAGGIPAGRVKAAVLEFPIRRPGY